MIDDKTIAFIGCKDTTKDCMQRFLRDIGPIDVLITIPPALDKKHNVSGYVDLQDFAHQHDIEIYHIQTYSLSAQKDRAWIQQRKIDLAFCIGWQRLIPKEILDIISIGVFGVHGSSATLPKGRGRATLNWALIQGKQYFYANLFHYADNVDGGDIIGTQRFEINDFDTIETMHSKNMMSMHQLVKDTIDSILKNTFTAQPQDHSKATYFPKRAPDDGAIDWHLSTQHIYNLCRAVTKPFPGAFSFIDKQKIIIWRCTPFSESKEYSDAKPGEIIEVFNNNKFAVKTRDSSLLIHEFETTNSSVIKKENVFTSVPFEDIYHSIEQRYSPHVTDDQKEITVSKMKTYYDAN
jgi:methionyl-tRNA formyltransferase